MKKLTHYAMLTCLVLAPQGVLAEGYTMSPDDANIRAGDHTLYTDGVYLGGSSYSMVPERGPDTVNDHSMASDEMAIGDGNYNVTPDWGHVGSSGYEASSAGRQSGK